MKRKVFVVAIIIIILDQVIKGILPLFLNPDSSITIIPNFFRITYVMNQGAAFNIFTNRISFLIMASILAIVVLIKYMQSFVLNKRNIIALGLTFGGISGNLIDRLFHGYVVDFLDFNFGNYYFPVFNFADSAIVIGIGLIIWAIIKGEDLNGIKGNK